MSFSFVVPPEIRFGKGQARTAAEALARLGRRPFLVTGGASFESLPIASLLSGLPRFAVSGEPEVATVDEGVARCRESGADVVLGVGGGSVLDTAKAVAGLSPHEGSVREYLEQVGDRKLESPPLPWIAVPTTAGSGSEATKNAVIRVPELRVKRSLRHERLLPRLAIVDPELSGTAPRPVAASAGLDALTHLIEGFVSSGANGMTDALALPGIALAARGLRGLAGGRPDPESLALASLWGGMVLANAGLGAVHGLVAPLGGRCAIPHGMGCACLLVETMNVNLRALRQRMPENPALSRYGEVARCLGSATMEQALDDLQTLRATLGVRPLSSFGLKPDQFGAIVKDSRGGSMRSNPIELTDAELESILRAAMG